MLRAAARRPPPQLLPSALSCTNTTGWQPRLSTKYEWLLGRDGASGKEQFFLIGKNVFTGPGLDNHIQGDFSTAPPQNY